MRFSEALQVGAAVDVVSEPGGGARPRPEGAAGVHTDEHRPEGVAVLSASRPQVCVSCLYVRLVGLRVPCSWMGSRWMKAWSFKQLWPEPGFEGYAGR